jgi:hypothetical protein
MDERHPNDPAGRYVRILRGFGLGDAEIVALHGGRTGVEDADAPDRVRERHAGADAPTAYARLRGALARSERGVEVPVTGDHPPVDCLSDPLEAYGYDFGVDRDGDRYRLSVADAVSGLGDECAFEYPEGPLGARNVPALVHTVGELLDRSDLQFVLLTPGGDRWRFVLAETEGLAALRAEFGERIEAFGRPLLAANQPPAYAGGAPADSVYVGRDGGTERTTADEADGTVASTPEWIREAAAREGGLDAVLDALAESGPRTYVSGRTADDVLAEIPDSLGDGATETRTAGTDDAVDSLRDHRVPGAGPSTAVSDRPIDVLDDPDPDRRRATDDVDDATAEADAGDPAPSSPPDPGETAPDDESAADEPGETTPAEGEAGDSLVGGGPDEVVVEGSVDDILTDPGAREDETEPTPGDRKTADRVRGTDPQTASETPESAPETPPEGETAWEPIPEADPEESTEDAGSDDAGVEHLIEDAEGDSGPPDSWEPVGGESPIRDAESRGEGSDGGESDASPPESRFDGAMNPSNLDDDGGDGDGEEDGVVERIRDVFGRFRSR